MVTVQRKHFFLENIVQYTVTLALNHIFLDWLVQFCLLTNNKQNPIKYNGLLE